MIRAWGQRRYERQQYALYLALIASDPHSDTSDTLYDTWADALWEAGVRAPKRLAWWRHG